MSLLKEGDGVNFQRASCTLDGCVKIYTSRVDSVATETGKLLSGLAESRDKKKKGEDGENADGEGEDEEEEGEDGVKKKKKKVRDNLTRPRSFLLTGSDPTVIRSDARRLICATAAEEDGAGVLGRSALQEGLCRL